MWDVIAYGLGNEDRRRLGINLPLVPETPVCVVRDWLEEKEFWL